MGSVVIAIDGTAASGKGTLARRLAADLGFGYLDTGKLYRFIGACMIKNGVDIDNKQAVIKALPMIVKTPPTFEMLQDKALASDETGQAASKVAVIEDVRAALVKLQREFAQKPLDSHAKPLKGAILDGRDIGTVICPDAPLKLYITAQTKIRAQRRHKELQSMGISVTYDAVLADMLERDKRDSERANAPMKPADDAIVIDTSHMDIETLYQDVRSLVRETLAI